MCCMLMLQVCRDYFTESIKIRDFEIHYFSYDFCRQYFEKKCVSIYLIFKILKVM